jgi:hypothetical protein
MGLQNIYLLRVKFHFGVPLLASSAMMPCTYGEEVVAKTEKII